MSGALVKELENGLRDLHITEYCQVSAITLLLLDYFLTLPDEVECFWSGKWSYPRALFFLNRYGGIFFTAFNTGASLVTKNLTIQVGEAWGRRFIPASGTIVVLVVHLILCFRVYGLYNQSKKIACFLAFALLATAAGEIYIDLAYVPNFNRLVLGPNFAVCTEINAMRKAPLFWVPVIVYETITFGLVVYKAFDNWNILNSKVIHGRSLARVFFRDSVQYFFLVLIIYIINACVWTWFPTHLRYTTIGYALASISILGTRLLLNLRLEARKGIGRTEDESGMTIESIRFQSVGEVGHATTNTLFTEA